MSLELNRRKFIQNSAAFAASSFLPGKVNATGTPSFWRDEILTNRAVFLLKNFLKNKPEYQCLGLKADSYYKEYPSDNSQNRMVLEIFNGDKMQEEGRLNFTIELKVSNDDTLNSNSFAKELEKEISKLSKEEFTRNCIATAS